MKKYDIADTRARSVAYTISRDLDYYESVLRKDPDRQLTKDMIAALRDFAAILNDLLNGDERVVEVRLLDATR